MNQKGHGARPCEQGFSLIEILAVLGIIAVMAAIGIPSIATYVRNYRINGAERSVSSDISATRTRAISRNTQAGVSFQVVDGNTYRFVVEDTVPPTFGDLHDLPTGVVFATPPGPFNPVNTTYFRFNRLGAWCDPNAGLATCPNTSAGFVCADARCNDVNPGVNYLFSDAGGTIIGLREVNTGLVKVLRVSPGGRIASVPQ